MSETKKIRVLLVSNTLSCGGAERQLVMLANTLQSRGDYEVDTLYYAQEGGEFSTLVPRAIFVDKAKLGGFRTVFAIKRVMRENDYDVVQVFGGTTNLYGRLAALLAHRKVIVGAVRGRSLGGRANRLLNNFINLFCKDWVVNNPAMIPYLKGRLRHVRSDRVKLIYNGFEPADRVDYAADRETDYDRDKKNAFIYTTVGRLAPVKNHPLLLNAFQKVHEIHPDTRLWIIGDGEEKERLNACAKELGVESAVRFWGFRSDTDAALYRTDAYVQSSNSEGTSNSVIEAMRASKPVVTTDCTDLSLTVKDPESGYIVPVRDLDALYHAMTALYEASTEARAEMGKAGYQLFQKTFTAEGAANAYDALYRERLEEKRR